MEQDNVGDVQPEISDSGKKDTVSYETHRKMLNDLKKAQTRLKEIEQAQAEREQASLAEQGKYKEQAEALSKKLKDYEAKVDSQTKTFAKQIFTKEAKATALALGADPVAVEDLIKVADWSDVEIDEQFNIDQEKLKSAILNTQKAKPWFFKRNPSGTKDVALSNSVDGKKPVTEMSQEEIIKQLKSLG